MARFGTLPALLALGIAVLALGIVVPESLAQPTEAQPVQLADHNADVIVDLVQGLRLESDYRSWYGSSALENASDHAGGILPDSSFESMAFGGVKMYVYDSKGNKITDLNQTGPITVEAIGAGINNVNRIPNLYLYAFKTSDCSGQFAHMGNPNLYPPSEQRGPGNCEDGTCTFTYAVGSFPSTISTEWCFNLILAVNINGGETILASVNDLMSQ
jgi:hypothetical protein